METKQDQIDQTDDDGELSLRQIMLWVLPMLVLAIGAIWWAVATLLPPPQRTLVISTGSQAGAYHVFGERYQRSLRKQGIATALRTSAGSPENLQRLRDPKSGVLAALIQGGVATDKTEPGLLSIGSMFVEPVWIFYRGAEPIDRIGQLRGKRISVGPEGSGTRALAVTLLESSQLIGQGVELMEVTGAAGRDALKAGTIDAMFAVAAAETPLIQDMLKDPDIKLMSLSQAEALSRLFPYLSKVTLPQGVVSLENNLPARDVTLVAAVASLVVRDDLHPALITQLTQAAAEAHSGANWFQRAGQFPMQNDSAFTMSPDAVRFYKTGPSFLQRYLPFWLANFLERMIVLLVPMATVAIPLVRGGPAIYRWNIRRKLQGWYARLQKLERAIQLPSASAPTSQISTARRLELDDIDASVARSKVPKAFAEQFYNLRVHIDYVRSKLVGIPGWTA